MRRWLIGIGAVIMVAAITVLAIYFAQVGLEQADMAASVVGALVAVAGLAVSVYGIIGPPSRLYQRARASGRGQINQVGGDQRLGEGGAGAPVEGGSVRQDAVASETGQINQIGGGQSSRLPPQT